MSNSATSAAKRRRAAPMITPPVFSSNLSQESTKLPSQPSSSTAPPSQQQQDMKLLTLQQVISLVDSRLTNLEKNLIEPKSNSSEEAPLEVSDLIKTLLYDHLAEFNERYELLAAEIANLKNIVIDLQSYTMNINKTLFEERIKVMSNVSEFTNSEDRLIFFNNNSEETVNEDVSISNDAPESGVSIISNEVVSDNLTFSETVPVSEDQSLEIEISSKTHRRGRGSNKKTQIKMPIKNPQNICLDKNTY
jgi:hypothetical protein